MASHKLSLNTPKFGHSIALKLLELHCFYVNRMNSGLGVKNNPRTFFLPVQELRDNKSPFLKAESDDTGMGSSLCGATRFN